MRLIGQAHVMLHEKGVVRIQTDIRVGSRYVRPGGWGHRYRSEEMLMDHRIDKQQSFEDKVTVVEKLLGADEK